MSAASGRCIGDEHQAMVDSGLPASLRLHYLIHRADEALAESRGDDPEKEK